MTIRPASYSGVRVYEIQARGVPVMRRMADAYINATQILRAAGLPKPQRTKILERDVTGGIHEKVQGGYAGFQGTWIPLDSARLLAAAHGVEQDLEELFSYTPKPGDSELPAKEKRKRAPKEPAAVHKEEKPKNVVIREPAAMTPLPREDEFKPKEKWTSSSSSHPSDNGFQASDGMPSSASDNDAYNQPMMLPHPMHDQHEEDAAGMLHHQQQMPGTPENRRTTKMSLRPPGTRVKRRPVYPGEDDEESYVPSHPTPPSSGKKRRYDSPVHHLRGPSPVNLAKEMQAYVGGGGVSHFSRSPSVSRDKTPPHAGKRCEGCGVTSTPQWRRGPSGKRTLCNACGVKWSFGRLNPQSGKSHTGDDDDDESETSSSESDDMEVDIVEHNPLQFLHDPQHHVPGPMDQLLLAAAYGLQNVDNDIPGAPLPAAASAGPRGTKRAAGTQPLQGTLSPGGTGPSTAHLESQIKVLKRKLRESERGRKRLCKILEEAVHDDSKIDNGYRRVVSKVAASSSTTSSGINSVHYASSSRRPIAQPRSTTTGGPYNYALPRYRPLATPPPQQQQQQQSESESDDSADDAAEQVVVIRFLRAVRENRKKMEYNIGRMCLTSTATACH